ncbi:MAG TPA: response regulator [Sediminispirochaeta sp.]|nr:response regulator [Sediminispirochaeta sp.]
MTKILLVDDSFIARHGIKTLLSDHTFEVVEAKDGKEALDLIDQITPDLILLDLLMPQPDGFKVLEELHKRDSSSPPVIILSADIQSTTRDRCMALGAAGFLKKPPHRDSLITSIMELTGQ